MDLAKPSNGLPPLGDVASNTTHDRPWQTIVWHRWKVPIIPGEAKRPNGATVSKANFVELSIDSDPNTSRLLDLGAQ